MDSLATAMHTRYMEVRLRCVHSRFAVTDERWTTEIVSLARELNSSGLAAAPARAKPGAKGAEVAEIVLALISTGGIASLNSVLKTWLHRDKNRTAQISRKDKDGERQITVSADTVDSDGFNELLKALVERGEGGE